MRDTRGQASIDWIVVVGVVTVALAVAGSVAGGAQIAAVVVRQFDRALCIVSGGDCNEDRAPCTTASSTDVTDESLNIVFVKVSQTDTLLIERRSDGTYRITKSSDGGLGFDVGIGGHFSFSGLGLKLALGGEARASVLAHIGGGQTWLARSADEVATDVKLLSTGRHPPGRPVQHYSQHGEITSLSGSVAAGLDLAVSGSYSQDHIDGTRTDANGDVTTYFRERIDDDVAATLDGLAGLSLTGMHSTEFALRRDRTGRPVDFELITVGRGAAGPVIPGHSGDAVKVTPRHGSGEAYEVEQHLDLSDPENLAAARAFFQAPDVGTQFAALRGLDARFAVTGVDQARTFSLKQDSFGISARVALGAKVGGSYKHTSLHMKLTDARVRGADGIWTTRDDCLAAARRV
jgi:hypothetical protein